MKQNVISREYKIMLQKERFIVSKDDLLENPGELKEKLAAWVDPDGPTKTAYVYSRAS